MLQNALQSSLEDLTPIARPSHAAIAFIQRSKTPYDSVEIFALPFVTFTPNCFARATISIRLREDTACAILIHCQPIWSSPRS